VYALSNTSVLVNEVETGRMGRTYGERHAYKVLVWKLKERDLHKGLDMDGKITATQTSEKCGQQSSSSGHGPVAGS
jgi:hypothetical protein